MSDYMFKASQAIMDEIENNKKKQEQNLISHPRHYNREGAIECIDEMELIYGPEAVMWFCLLNAHKYRYRAGLKDNGYQDIEKSDWYMKKYKELKEKNNLSTVINPIIQSPTWQPWQITYSGTSQPEVCINEQLK